MTSLDFARQTVELGGYMKAELERVAKKVGNRSKIEIRTYAGGLDPYSLKVSLARALLVRSYLIDQGIKARAVEIGAPITDWTSGENRIDVLAPDL
jgi:outer membrane protein OmpA-like peptidoglycan-associated protein